MSELDETDLLAKLDLKEYESEALNHLLVFGRTTAPNIAEATGIPKARVYGVLDSLADRGFIKIIPGRPKEYQPKSPAEILKRATENRRQEYETYRRDIDDIREEFLSTFEPQFQKASEDISPTEELFHVVDVGDPSESETRALYQAAEQEINVLTKSFEYLDDIEPALENALERGVTISVLFVHPQQLAAENRSIQDTIVDQLANTYPSIDYRFSNNSLPWRGTFADPSPEYDSGRAILLVEENEIPLHMRQAAVTENGSFVSGLDRYFELIWNHDSTEPPVHQ